MGSEPGSCTATPPWPRLRPPWKADNIERTPSAERSTAGNVTGTIYAVAARPYRPTRAEWNAAAEAVGADRIPRTPG